MIVYHGSYTAVDTPDLSHSRLNVDFGKAFYATPIHDQAVRWCDKFKRRGKKAIVSSYVFDEAGLQELKVLNFDSYSEDWLNFILNCRRGLDTTDYDLVIGGIANDKVFNTVELFFDGFIEKAEAINRLRYNLPNLQMAFRTKKGLSYLKFEGLEIL